MPEKHLKVFLWKYFVFICLFIFLACGGSRADYIEVLYVNANVGAAAGGHTALKLGDDVFHYQFFPDERFLLIRESWPHFRLIYNKLRNRSIFSAPCWVSGAVFQQIKENFTATLAAQQYDMYRERFFREQQELLGALESGHGRVMVAGLGFFNNQQSDSVSGVILRTFVNQRLGGDFLGREKERTELRLQQLKDLLNTPGTTPEIVEEKLAKFSDTIKKLSALEVLHGGIGLTDPALVRESSVPSLTVNDIRGMSAYLERLKGSIANLLHSERPDSGETIILQVARYHAVSSSIQKGVLLTLDPFPDDATVKYLDLTDQEMRSYLVELSSLLMKEGAEVFGELIHAEGVEADVLYMLLEQVNGRLAELSGVLHFDLPVRLAAGHTIPSRKRSVNMVFSPFSEPVYESLSSPVRKKQAVLAEEIKQRYHYSLMDRNCVNELLKTINDSFSSRVEVERALGGWIDPVSDRVIIPHDFFYRVRSKYRVAEIEQYRSRRLAALEELSASGAPLLWFQEGNTMTSTLYKPRKEDTPFLFFTDNIDWPRPVLGLVNLTWAVGHSIGGLFMLPVDDGQHLWQGMRGMFYSLPELVFCNIRKGTYLHDDLTGRENEL